MEPIVWAILLLCAGIALLVLEMFIPSHGLLGVLAAAAIIGGVVMAFRQGLLPGSLTLLTAAILVPLVLFAGLQIWPKTPFGRRMLISAADLDDPFLDDHEQQQLAALVGQRGKAKSKMLPSGAVVIGGRTYDAVSMGGPIEPGEAIVVTSFKANRIAVRPLSEAEARAPLPFAAASTAVAAPLMAPINPAVSQPVSQPVSKTVAPQLAGDPALSQPAEALGIEPIDDPLR